MEHVADALGEVVHYEQIARVEDIGTDKWLEFRKLGIGASEAAALIGESPWKSELQLYAEKAGIAPTPDLSGVEAVEWGTRLEPVIREVYAERSGRHTDRGGILLRSLRYPWALATLDGWTAKSELGPYWPLELKTTGVGHQDDWAEGPPRHYEIQIQWQMLVTGAPKATIACLIGGQRLVWCDVERDEVLIRRLAYAGEKFWERVEQGQPPPPDGSISAKQALVDLYPRDDGSNVELPGELCEVLDELEICKAEEKQIQLRKTTAENRIKAELGDALTGWTRDGRVVTWKTEERNSYTVAASTRRVLRVKQPKQYKGTGT